MQPVEQGGSHNSQDLVLKACCVRSLYLQDAAGLEAQRTQQVLV